MVLNEKLKKYLALGLAVSVMSFGILSASTSTASAKSPAPTTVTSQDGKDITVTGGDASKLHLTKKDNFHANINYTSSTGKNQNIEVTVTPLPNEKYQIETQEQGVNHVAISAANPLDNKKMMGLQTKYQNPSSPDVLISVLWTGHADYYTLVSVFGLALTDKIMSNWGALTEALVAGGYWAVFEVMMSWEIVGIAVVLAGMA